MHNLTALANKLNSGSSRLTINEIKFECETSESIENFAEKIASSANLKYIKFWVIDFNKISFEKLSPIFTAIQKLSSLSTLAFDSCCLADASPEFLYNLAHAISKCQNLFNLSLHFSLPFNAEINQLENTLIFLKIILNDIDLITLDLSDNPFGQLSLEGFQEFCRCLSESQRIIELNLNRTCLDELEEGSLIILSEAIAKANTRTLYLNGNDLALNSDFNEFIEKITTISHFKNLDLSKNDLEQFFNTIPSNQLELFANTIKNSHMHKLDLGYNKLGSVKYKQEMLMLLVSIATKENLQLILTLNGFEPEAALKLQTLTNVYIESPTVNSSLGRQHFLAGSSANTSSENNVIIPKTVIMETIEIINKYVPDKQKQITLEPLYKALAYKPLSSP